MEKENRINRETREIPIGTKVLTIVIILKVYADLYRADIGQYPTAAGKAAGQTQASPTCSWTKWDLQMPQQMLVCKQNANNLTAKCAEGNYHQGFS